MNGKFTENARGDCRTRLVAKIPNQNRCCIDELPGDVADHRKPHGDEMEAGGCTAMIGQ